MAQKYGKSLLEKFTGMERIKNENTKEIMVVKGKPDIIDIIEQKKLKWYGRVKRMP